MKERSIDMIAQDLKRELNDLKGRVTREKKHLGYLYRKKKEMLNDKVINKHEESSGSEDESEEAGSENTVLVSEQEWPVKKPTTA